MELKIKYGKIVDCINLLDQLKLSGIKSIHRTRLSKKLSEKLQDVAEDEKKLMEDYSDKDEDGNAIINDDKYQINDMDGLVNAKEELFNEDFVIDDSDSQKMLETVKTALENDETEWQGKEAYTFEYLYSAFNGEDVDADGENE